MANHISYLDAPALMSNLPGRTVVFLKSSLMKIPILGYAFKLAHFIPVDRTGDVAKARSSPLPTRNASSPRTAHHDIC
jgi:1-acyl-sn-glycerol-3-phosphate acyltransferase